MDEEEPQDAISRSLEELKGQVQQNLSTFQHLRPLVEEEAERRYPKSEEAKAAEQKLVDRMSFAPVPPNVFGMDEKQMKETVTQFLAQAEQFMQESGYYEQPPPPELIRQCDEVTHQFIRLMHSIDELADSLNGRWHDPSRQ